MRVVAMVVMPAEHGTGKENHRHNENNPRDNHDPRGDLIKPARRCWVRLRWRSRCDSTRLSRRFGYFAHVLMMPLSLLATTPDRADEEENRRDDEDNPRDDRHPRRDLIEPVRP